MQDDSGFFHFVQDGTLMYTPALATVASFAHTHSFSFAAPASQTFLVTSEQAHTLMTTTVAGHEAAGPQKTDAPEPKSFLESALDDIFGDLWQKHDGRAVDNAISALHRQHTRDGRPSRFMPETE